MELFKLFSPFRRCFQRPSLVSIAHVISELSFGKGLTLYHTVRTFDDPEKEVFWKNCGKGENAGDQHFLLFPQCYLPISKRISVFQLFLFCRLQMHSIWTSIKNLSFGKGLKESGSSSSLVSISFSPFL